MFVSTFDGPTKERGYWNFKSFNWKICLDVLSKKGLNLYLTYNDTKGLNMFMKKMPKPFNESHYNYKRDWTQPKKKELDKKWTTFIYKMNTLFNIVQHFTFIKAMKATLESQTYYKPSSYMDCAQIFLNNLKSMYSQC